jgi:Domain of unknown function (DUF1788)
MSAIDRLLTNYTRQVRLPWSASVSGKQRVWFAVYQPSEERRVRARLPQFEEVTLGSGHGWSAVDLTGLLPDFLANHKYREAIFEKPQHLKAGTQLEARAAEMVATACTESDENSVVVVTGLASLFDFMRVSTLIDRVEDSVRGRLLVMFPGEFQGTLYRFMDARDGFNYMATPITTTESFLTP